MRLDSRLEEITFRVTDFLFRHKWAAIAVIPPLLCMRSLINIYIYLELGIYIDARSVNRVGFVQ